MKILIIKTGASGDVLRTTFLSKLLSKDEIHWFTTKENACLVNGIVYTNPKQYDSKHYDLVINLEEDKNIFVSATSGIKADSYIGPYLLNQKVLTYTLDSSEWFNMSRISVLGKETSDAIKFSNRRSYQEIVATMIGKKFSGEKYYKPTYNVSDRKFAGDIGMVISDSSVWPTKNWAHMKELENILEVCGYKINFLKRRKTIKQYIADLTGHKLVICSDSLPMHICIAHKIPCITMFTCTSPWEIEDYGIVTKVISPLLHKHYYKTSYNKSVAESIRAIDVAEIVQHKMEEI